MVQEMKKNPRAALGRGLSALISSPVPIQSEQPPAAVEADNSDTDRVAFIAVDKLRNNPDQPRQVFKDAELEELSQSIKALGLIQPVLVRPTGDGHYEIVAGERRWRAAQRAGLDRIPVIVRELSDRDVLEQAIVENVQRENLNPIEEARAYQRLCDEFSLSHKEVAERVGKDRTTVSNLTRLLKLPDDVIALVQAGELTTGHAKAILSIKEPSAQSRLAKKCVAESLSVRDLESIVSRVIVLDAGKRSSAYVDAATQGAPESVDPFPGLVDRLRNALGTKIRVKHHSTGKGRIEIEYFSEQELDRLAEILCRTAQG